MLVTGASRGLGRAIAETFGRQGAHVAVGYLRNDSQAEETARRIEEGGGAASIHGFDVRKPEEVAAAVATIEEEHGLDVLVNNAGVVADDLALTMPTEKWERVIDANLHGTFYCSRAAADVMVRRKSGVIINIASVAAVRAHRGQANYAAAKGGVLAYTRTLAAEVARFGIRVNAVVPGLLDVGMGQRVNRDIVRRAEDFIPAGRRGTAQEVADVIAFLASDEARYVIGHSLVVDGGMSL